MKSIVSSFTLVALSSAINLIFNLLLAKLLGGHNYGTIIYFMSLINIIVLLIDFNNPALYMRFKIVYSDKKTFDLVFTYKTVVFLFLLIPIVFLLCKFFLNDCKISFLVSLIAYMDTILKTAALEFNSSGRINTAILVSLFLPRSLIFIFFMVLLFFGYSSPLYYLYVLLLVNFILCLILLIKFKPFLYLRLDFLKRAWKFYLLGILGLGFNEMAKILQKELGDFTKLASLAIALLIINGLSMIGSVMGKYAFPKLHEAWKNRNIRRIEQIYRFHILLSTFSNMPILLFLSFNIGFISEVLGTEYIDLPYMFYILLIGYIFDLLTGITGSILKATGNEHFEIFNETLRFAIGVAIMIVFRNSHFSIVLALAISNSIFNLLKYLEVFLLFRLKPLSWIEFKMFFSYLGSLILILSTLYSFVYRCNKILFLFISFSVILLYHISFYYKYIKKKLDFSIYLNSESLK